MNHTVKSFSLSGYKQKSRQDIFKGCETGIVVESPISTLLQYLSERFADTIAATYDCNNRFV